MLDGDCLRPYHFTQGATEDHPAQGITCPQTGFRKGSPLLETLEMFRLYIHCTCYETVFRAPVS